MKNKKETNTYQQKKNSNWKTVKLEEICYLYQPKTISKKEMTQDGQYPVFGANGIIGKYYKYNHVESEVLITCRGASCGTINISKPKSWITGNAMVVSPSSNNLIYKTYLFYFLKQSKFASCISGAAQPQITRQNLSIFQLSLPSLPEQKKIVEILSTWDRAIETINKLISAKEKQFKWLLKNLITDQKNNPNWKTVKLEEITHLKKGQQINKRTLNKVGQYPVQNGGIEPSGYTDKWNTKENTITISEGGNSCGFIKLNKKKFWSGGHCYSLINISKRLDNQFLFYYLKNNEQKIMKLRVGSGLPNIQKKSIERFLINYPNLRTQKGISEKLSTSEKEIEILNQLSKKYEKQKKGLMQKLLTGKKRITDE